MKKAENALEESGFQMPLQPSEEDRKRIMKVLRRNARTLGLTPTQDRELHLVLEHYFQDVEAWHAKLQRIQPRSERVLRLRRIEKAMRRVQYEVEKSSNVLDEILPSELSEKLGSKLTFAALGAAIGSGESFPNLCIKSEAFALKGASASIELMEAEFDHTRRALGLRHAGAIFQSMINDLYAPLGKWVEFDKKPAGRKPNFLQHLLIARLAGASERIIGRRASSTPGGPFVELCRTLFDGLGFPLGDVRKMVALVLKKRRMRRDEL